MFQLFFLFALAVILAILMVFFPLIRGEQRAVDPDLKEQNQNKGLFFEKKEGLENDLKSGEITQQDYSDLLNDLERSLLDDFVGQSDDRSSRNTNKTLLLFCLLFIPLLSLSYFFYLTNYQEAFKWINLKNTFSESLEPISAGSELSSEVLNNIGMADFVRLMQADLQQNDPAPDLAVKGWYILGISYLKSKNFDTALYALKRADEIEPGREDIQFGYVQALIFRNNGLHTKESRIILNQLLKKNTNHQGALMLSGVTSFNEGDYESAINLWEQLLDLRQIQGQNDLQNDEAGISQNGQKILLASIAKAREKLNESLENNNNLVNRSDKSATKVVLKIRIQVIRDLRKYIKEGDSLFVFVKAHQGPNIPLAAVRFKDFKFPKTVNLDDSSAMSPDLKISAFNKVVVTARINKSSKAQLMPGDLEGISEVVSLQTGINNVSVIVDRLSE